jgi:putative hemolysin
MDPTGGCTSSFPFPLLLAQAETHWGQGLAPVLVCVVLVLMSSFLAAMCEAAYLALSTTRAKAMEQSDNANERLAGKMRLDFAKPLAAMVVVNNAHIAGSTLAGYYAKHYFEDQGVADGVDTAMGVFTAVLTLVVIIWGEIVPKTIGENHSFVIAKYAAYPVRAVTWLLSPILHLMHFAQRPFQRVGPHPTTEDEIAQLASIGQEQGAIEEHEGDMIHRVLKLNDIYAEQIMTPRAEMIALPADQTIDDAAGQLEDINRSLIPVYGKNRDEVVAILDRMDALLALAKDKGRLLLTDPSVSFKPFYVPKSMPADELLVKFQRRTEHMAIVVGEYGETVGLVTLEDVLEEIVGEIYDEEDIDTGNGVQQISPEELLVAGASEIKAVNEALATEIPNHRSVAGFLLDELERIPAKGEEHLAHGLSFRIEEANERAILKVRVKKLPPPVTEEEARSEAASD